MTATALTNQTFDSIGFSRLHALAARGYRPVLGAAPKDDGHICIPLTHPRAARKNPPPAITLWSDGIVSTSAVLWPEKLVPSEEAPPAWQKYILPDQGDRFDSFVAGIRTPDVIDLYLKPFWAQAKLFTVRLMFGTALCTVLGIAAQIIRREI